jgi:hypothetical protein
MNELRQLPEPSPTNLVGFVGEALGGDTLRRAKFTKLEYSTKDVRLDDGRDVEVDMFGTGPNGVHSKMAPRLYRLFQKLVSPPKK